MAKQQIGAMNQVIAFRTFLTGRDAYGGVEKTWLTSNEIWAAVEFKEAGTDEEFIADRPTSVVSTVFRIRQREGISAYMRVLYRGNEYNILGVMPQVNKTYMLLKTELTEPEQYVKYWTEPNGQIWLDPAGNPWEWIGDGGGANEPVKKPYMSPGSLTWKDAQNNIWYQNPTP